MKDFKKCLIFAVIVVSRAFLISEASNAGSSGGLTLIEAAGARASALGEAFTAVTDDISAFKYNPASLNSLKTGQGSFLYQKGVAEDSFGQFSIGSPLKHGGMGLSIGYYNSGTIELFDGTETRSVSAQKDMTVSLGYARTMGNFSVGVTGKYLSSMLIDQYKATAYAADFGLNMALGSRFTLGGAIQNIGTPLTFISEGDPLPRIARAGMAMNLIPGANATSFMIDVPYYMNEKEARPALGLETNIGPLAMRAGLRKRSSVNEFTVGAGFLLGRSNIDYSFGLAKDLSNEQKVSFSMRFGNGVDAGNKDFVKKSKTIEVAERIERIEKKNEERKEEAQVVFATRHSLSETLDKKSAARTGARRIYVVQAGDTLSKIARKVYGDSRQSKRIFVANKHLLSDESDVEAGQKIVLP